jgi:hypothetical protein
MDSFSPTNAFMSVDFPTFGLPTMFTKADLWDILCDLNFETALKAGAKIRNN